MTPLDQYLSNPPPGYAVLLAGAWGSGKSFLWRQYSDTIVARGKQPVTFSVAGLKTYEELESALFQASINDVGPQALREASALIGRTLLRYLKIDPDEIKLKADFHSGRTVVCLDDVERFGGEFITLFGFVVNIIDKGCIHCVLLADEQKALSRYEDYASYKERIVGKTIPLVPDLNKFCATIVAGFSDDDTRHILESNFSFIVAQLARREISNLRTARYFLTELAAVVSECEIGSHADLTPLISAMAFWTIGAARSAGNLPLVAKAFVSSKHSLVYFTASGRDENGSDSGGDERKAALLIRELGFEGDVYSWPTSSEFARLVLGGNVDYSQISEDFNLGSTTRVESASVRIRDGLNGYRGLTDAQLQELIVAARDLLATGLDSDLSIAFDIFRSLYWMAESGLFAFSTKEWSDEMIRNVASYDPSTSKLNDVRIEVYGVSLADDEARVLEAFRELGSKIEQVQLAATRAEWIDSILNGTEALPELVTRDRVFDGVDPQVLLGRLISAGTPAVLRLHKMVRQALRVSNASAFISAESGFYRTLAELIEINAVATVPMTILSAELIALSKALSQLAEHVAPR